jgi:DNA-binding transcriptional MerR regulator
MLTIGQLAAHAGVTVRTVRHYHQTGLLPEPERDSSGYRRYDAQAVVDLIRIRTLAGAGVPLARIAGLLRASPAEFEAAVASIDRDVRRQIATLTEHRRQLASLTAGDRLFLPPEIVAILDRMRALGHSERLLRIERDLWIMAYAMSPGAMGEWVAAKTAAMDDPVFADIYLRLDAALEWAPSDPRLPQLAADIRAWDAGREKEDVAAGLDGLMTAHVTEVAPAWRRLSRLLS